MALRIIHVITRLYRAGSEENTATTCLGQAAEGHDVVVAHGSEFDPSWRDRFGDRVRLVEVPSLVHPVRPLTDMRAVRDLARLFARLKPDVVHTHQSKAGLVGRIAAAIARTPVVVHGVHIVPFLNVGAAERLVYLAAERAAARLTHAFVDVSAGMRDACLAAGVGRPDNHFVVYSGMNLDAFPGAAPPDDWRALLGVEAAAPKPPVVLMLAALEPRKRHIELIEAFAAVVARHPQARLVLAGEGPHRPAVEAAIARTGLGRTVRLIGFHPRPASLIALADLCVLTSMREGLPRVVVQYVAGGRPVVVSRVPGIEEIVADGRNGVIADADRVADAARIVAELLDDPARLAALRAGAEATDVSAWRADALVRGVAEVYARFLPEPPPATPGPAILKEVTP